MSRCAIAFPAYVLFELRRPDRNAAIATAYATGDYSYATIAVHFGIHLSTVG